MAEDRISLDLKIQTQEAKKEIDKLNESLAGFDKQIDDINKKSVDISGGDLDKFLGKYQKVVREMGGIQKRMEKDLSRSDARTAPVKDSSGKSTNKTLGRNDADFKKGLEQFKKESNNLFSEYAQEFRKLEQASASQSRMFTSRAKMRGGTSWGDKPFPKGVDLETRQTQRDRQKVTSRVTSSVSGLQRAGDTGHLTHRQNEILKGQIDDVFHQATGSSKSDKDKVLSYAKGETGGKVNWDADQDSPFGRGQERIKSSSNKIQSLEDDIKGIQDQRASLMMGSDGKAIGRDDLDVKTSDIVEDLDLAENKAIDEIKKQQKLREENKKLLTEIVDGIRRLDKSQGEFVQKTGGEGITTGPKEGTLAHGIESRSNAIALSAVTAAFFSISKSMQEGKGLVEDQREPSMQIGFGTGDYDFRGIREDARDSGIDYGFTGEDMLGFRQDVMGSMGYSSENMGVTSELARGERLSGAESGTMTSLFDTTLRSGAVSDKTEARDLVDAVAGGIEASGMKGREEEHLTTLQAILAEQGKGRKVSNEESKRTMALLNQFSSSGNEAMQGENLLHNIGSVQEGLASEDPFGAASVFLAQQDPEKYMGPGGMHERMKAFEEGLANEDILNMATSQIQTAPSKGVAYDMMRSLGYTEGMSGEGIEEFYKQAMDGSLTADSADELSKEYTKEGAQKTAEADAGFEDSPDSTAMRKDSYKEKAQGMLADNKITDFFTGMSESFWEFSSKSPAHAAAGTVGLGAAKGVGMGLLGTLGMGGSSLIKGALSSKTGGIGGMMLGKEGLGSLLPSASGEGAGGLGSLLTSTAGKGAKGLGSMLKTGASSVMNMSEGTAMTGLKTAGTIKTVMDAGKGIYEVATADNKKAEAASQGGEFAGKTAGGWGGGAIGAAIGTAILPGVGTAIGGALGGGIGSWGGGKGGKSIGDWAADKWLGGTDEQNAEASLDETQQEEVATEQGEVALATEQVNIESRREDNVIQETKNLSDWDKLVKDIRELLEVARKQNGIIGNTNGMGANGGGTGVGGGELGVVSSGDYWTSANLQEHDVTKTSSELTAGELDAWIEAKAPSNSEMLGMGEAFMKAGNKHGIDPRVLMSIGAHESAWGTSDQAKNKKNFFGMNANTNSPEDAYSYESGEASIMNAADTLRRLYVGEGLKNLKDMGPKYADDPKWASGVANHLKGAENYTSKSSGDININTTVNVDSKGGTSKDEAKQSAKEFEEEVRKKIPPMFRWDQMLMQ